MREVNREQEQGIRWYDGVTAVGGKGGGKGGGNDPETVRSVTIRSGRQSVGSAVTHVLSSLKRSGSTYIWKTVYFFV